MNQPARDQETKPGARKWNWHSHTAKEIQVFFGPAARKVDQDSKTKTGAGKSSGGEQKLETMKPASELQHENK
jgi:hypothetical protein